jgi:hypothetical protein
MKMNVLRLLLILCFFSNCTHTLRKEAAIFAYLKPVRFDTVQIDFGTGPRLQGFFTEVGQEKNYYFPCFNPNNENEICFIQATNKPSDAPELWFFNFETGLKRKITTNLALNASKPMWGKNGWILFTRQGNDICKVKPTGDSLIVLIQGHHEAAIWSEKGDKILYWSPYIPGIILKDLQTAQSDTFPTTPETVLPQMFQDNKIYGYGNIGQDHFGPKELNILTRTVRNLDTIPFAHYSSDENLVQMQDGWIYYNTSYWIKKRNLVTNERQVLTYGGNLKSCGSLRFSPNKKYGITYRGINEYVTMYHIKSSANLYLIDLETQQEYLIQIP